MLNPIQYEFRFFQNTLADGARSRSRNLDIPAPAPAKSFGSLRLRLHNTGTNRARLPFLAQKLSSCPTGDWDGGFMNPCFSFQPRRANNKTPLKIKSYQLKVLSHQIFKSFLSSRILNQYFLCGRLWFIIFYIQCLY